MSPTDNRGNPDAFRHWLSVARENPKPGTRDLWGKPDDLAQLAANAIAYADQRADVIVPENMRARLACARGCHHCCYLPVETSVPEAIHLALAARSTFNKDTLAAVSLRTHAAAAAYGVAATTGAPPENIPCPILKDGACGLYGARPLACRGWNSLDASVCEQAKEQGTRKVKIPLYTPLRTVYATTGAALAKGLSG
ncbi:MAG: hypothetical protein DRQ37_06705, partial [Gammaproteobacteria bacterium]